jgi:hypothetical protein
MASVISPAPLAVPQVCGFPSPKDLLPSDLLADKLHVALCAVLQDEYRDEDLRGCVLETTIGSLSAYLSRFAHWSQIIGTVEPDVQDEEFRAWVYCLTERHVRWAVKGIWRKKRKRSLGDEATLNVQAAELPPIIYAAVFRAVLDAANRLPAKRRLVALDHLDCISIEESAQHSGLTESTVKSYRKEFMHQARRVIAEQAAAFGY